MNFKITKEWFLKTKWGKVAMISWGDRHRPGVLMVHGYLDSAATFESLMSLLPDTYYYVSFDFPGHGKSDSLLTGQLVHQAFITEIIREIVDHLHWKSFICIGHSIGFLIASLFHQLYPGRINKMINIDPVYPASQYYYINEDHALWFMWHYEYYYDHYDFYNGASPRLFTLEKLIESTMKTRKLTREQAEIVLSRSLVPVENGLYRISTQAMMKRILNIPAFKETFIYILTHNIPPTLNLHGNNTKMTDDERKFAKQVFLDSPKRAEVYFDAGHDLHITHADELVPHIVEFLCSKNSKAKL